MSNGSPSPAAAALTAQKLISILSKLPPETVLYIEDECGDHDAVKQVIMQDGFVVIDTSDYINDDSWVRSRPDLAATVLLP